MATQGIGAMLGPIIGPTVGGMATDHMNWRKVLSINLRSGC